MSGDELLTEHTICAKPWISVNLRSMPGSELCGVSIYSVSIYFCVPGPRLLCQHLLCVRASVVVAPYCVSGTGLLCEHLLCDYFLSASLCGILLLTLSGGAGRTGWVRPSAVGSSAFRRLVATPGIAHATLLLLVCPSFFHLSVRPYFCPLSLYAACQALCSVL